MKLCQDCEIVSNKMIANDYTGLAYSEHLYCKFEDDVFANTTLSYKKCSHQTDRWLSARPLCIFSTLAMEIQQPCTKPPR